LLLLQQISSKIPALVAKRRDSRIGLAEPPAPLFCLFYQVEIRCHQIPSSNILRPLTAADDRDNTMAMWQLRDGREVVVTRPRTNPLSREDAASRSVRF